MNICTQSWIVIAIILVFVEILIGYGARKHWLGILIDSRNRFSLSRLQIVLWSTVLISAFFSVLLQVNSTEIYIPPEVWALMGISTGSAAGAVMIKGTKAQQQPTGDAVQKQADRSGKTVAEVAQSLRGLLPTANKPRFSDLFTGEEMSDQTTVDIGKVQMFFFTFVAVIGYVTALHGNSLAVSPDGLKEHYCAYFPALSTSLLTLIGISHVGYLTVKATPKTPTQN